MSNAVIALRARSISTVGTAPGAESFDVGIASPNVLSCVTLTSYRESIASDPGSLTFENQYVEWSTPDLHPDGYPVVTDLLIGISADNAKNFASQTLELDVMLIAEPTKLSKNDLNDMLIQAQDL